MKQTQNQHPLGRKPLLSITADSHRWFHHFREILTYLDLFIFLVRRDLIVRYKHTALGIAWVLIQPLAMMLVLSIFFGFLVRFDSGQTPYPLFCYSGFLLWGFVSRSAGGAAESLIKSPGLVTKVYIPRIFLPLTPLVAGLIDLAVASALLLLLMAYYGIAPTLQIAAAPLFIAMAAMAALGVGLFSSALNAKFRDVSVIWPFIIQVWMFLTPVFYPVSLVPEGLRIIWALNPLVGAVQGLRWAVLGSDIGSWYLVAIGSGSAAVLLIAGFTYFSAVEDQLADIV